MRRAYVLSAVVAVVIAAVAAGNGGGMNASVLRTDNTISARNARLQQRLANRSASAARRLRPAARRSRASQRFSPARRSSSSSSAASWDLLRTGKRRGGGGGANPAYAAPESAARSSGSSTPDPTAPTIALGNISKNFGDAAFGLSPASDSAGSFSFDSSNTAVATIAGSTFTIIGAGTTTITVTQAANGNYTSGTTTATLTVHPVAPTIGAFADVTKQVGDLPFALTAPASNSAGAFSYVSSDTGVATVSGNTVTIVSSGIATITATQAANGNYTSGIKTMTLTVFTGECFTDPCMSRGICTNEPGGTFSCACDEPYSGVICELSDEGCNYDHGALQGCVNAGICVPDVIGGYCQCPANFCGQYCERPDTDESPEDGFCM